MREGERREEQDEKREKIFERAGLLQVSVYSNSPWQSKYKQA